jgi:hypothetical protein
VSRACRVMCGVCCVSYLLHGLVPVEVRVAQHEPTLAPLLLHPSVLVILRRGACRVVVRVVSWCVSCRVVVCVVCRMSGCAKERRAKSERYLGENVWPRRVWRPLLAHRGRPGGGGATKVSELVCAVVRVRRVCACVVGRVQCVRCVRSCACGERGAYRSFPGLAPARTRATTQSSISVSDDACSRYSLSRAVAE